MLSPLWLLSEEKVGLSRVVLGRFGRDYHKPFMAVTKVGRRSINKLSHKEPCKLGMETLGVLRNSPTHVFRNIWS